MEELMKQLLLYLQNETKEEIRNLKEQYIATDKRLNQLEKNECGRDQKIDNILSVVSELKVKIETIIQMPSQRWNNVQSVIVTTIVNGIIVIILAKLFGKI